MITNEPTTPASVVAIERATAAIGFSMPSDRLTGALLRVLAASKPGGSILELGTGTGLSAAWLLDGLDASGGLLSYDIDGQVQAIAQDNLGDDPRADFRLEEGGSALNTLARAGRTFDLIFADAWPGKYSHLETVLALLRPGALYVIDDMLPQPNWPDGHAANVERLLVELSARRDLQVVSLAWSTGIVIATKVDQRR